MTFKFTWAHLFAAALMLSLIVFAGERNLNGLNFAYAMNGSAEYLDTITDTAGGSATANTTPFEDGMNAMIQCDQNANVINAVATDSVVSTPSKFVGVAAGEKYPIGLLRVAKPFIYVECAAGVCNCLVYRIR